MGFKQVQDLVFRARNARLGVAAYELDFLNWVKAGIAFNTRGTELSTRKIDFFARVYKVLRATNVEDASLVQENHTLLSDALAFYYEDIFDVFQDYLKSSQELARNGRRQVVPDFKDLVVLPQFASVPVLYEVFNTVNIDLANGYVSQMKEKFLERVNSAYLKEGTYTYSCMSLMFDYGVVKCERDVLLEVKTWEP